LAAGSIVLASDDLAKKKSTVAKKSQTHEQNALKNSLKVYFKPDNGANQNMKIGITFFRYYE